MIASVPDLCIPFTFFLSFKLLDINFDCFFFSFGKNVVLAILFPFCIIK